jgi:hypothetical protein
MGVPMALRRNPIVYEINAWVWLADLSLRFGNQITLGNIPPEVIDEIVAWCPDALWLMGVWERSPMGREIAYKHIDLQRAYDTALPDFRAEDIVGSPYSVHRYKVDAHLGGPEELAVFRMQLRQHGIALILDYVPNHVALDHHWTEDCPDCLVRGIETDLINRPSYYYRAPNGEIFAHGRDPYWPAWTDTAQINAFSPAAREQSLDQVRRIAEQCDGVRCDMAMLVVNRIFGGLWVDGASGPAAEFWQEIIPTIKEKYPDFTFMAEVYWEMEAELQSLGFDYTYDKRLYDRLRHENVGAIRDHLLAASNYQRHMVRFVENHDEERALASFGLEKSMAAATITLILPGAKLIHEGQFEGRRVKLPVQLGRRQRENANPALLDFYKNLLREVTKNIYHDGIFMSPGVHPILSADPSHENIFAFVWVLGEEWRIAVINYSSHTAKGRVMLPRPEFRGLTPWAFHDSMHPGEAVLHVGNDLLTSGLPLELAPYETRIYSIAKG